MVFSDWLDILAPNPTAMLRALGSREADDARDAPEDGARRGIARFIRHPIIATISWVFVGDGDDDSDESCSGSDDDEPFSFPACEPALSELPVAVLAKRPDAAVAFSVSLSKECSEDDAIRQGTGEKCSQGRKQLRPRLSWRDESGGSLYDVCGRDGAAPVVVGAASTTPSPQLGWYVSSPHPHQQR